MEPTAKARYARPVRDGVAGSGAEGYRYLTSAMSAVVAHVSKVFLKSTDERLRLKRYNPSFAKLLGLFFCKPVSIGFKVCFRN